MTAKPIAITFIIFFSLLPSVNGQRRKTNPQPRQTVAGPPAAIVEPTDKKTEPLWVQIYGARVFRLYQDTHDLEVIYATTPRGLYKTTDRGFRWRFIFAAPFPDPAVTARENLGYYAPATAMVFAQSKSSPEVMFLGTNWNEDGRWPTIWKSEDGGTNWRDASAGIIRPSADAGQYFSNIQVSPSNALVAYVSVGGTIYKTLNGAKSWGVLRSGTFSLDSTNGDHIIVDAAESYDGGTTWTEKKFRSANVWFHTTHPTILFQDTHLQNNRFVYSISEDNGQTWRDIAMNEPMNCLAFSPKDDRVIFAGTQGGIYISHNRGLSWKKVFEGGAWSLAVVNDDVIYAAAGNNIWKTSNGGATWHTASLMLPTPMTRWRNDQMAFDRLCLVDDATGNIYVGSRRGYLMTTDDGSTWQRESPIQDPYASIISLKLAADGSKFFVTITPEGDVTAVGGVSQWKAFLVRATPQGKIESLASYFSGYSFISSHAWPEAETLFGVSESDSRIIYDGTKVSDDGGFSWRQGNITNANLRELKVVVSAASPKIAYVVSSGDSSSVFSTTNGGDTWSKLGMTYTPQALVTDPKDPMTVYAISSNQLLRSRNAGAVWEPLVNLSPLGNLTGSFAINPRDTNIFYLLSGNGLWESKNGGRSWHLFQTGLNEDRLERLVASGGKVLVQGRYGIYRLSNSGLEWAVDKWKTDEAAPAPRQLATAPEPETPVTTSTSTTTETASQPPSLDDLVALTKKLIDGGLNGDKALIDSYLADDYVWRDVGNRKTMDRAKFLSKVKRDRSIRNYSCGDYKISTEGALTSLSYVCEYDISSIVLANHVRQRFTDRYTRVNGVLKLSSEDTIVLPNNR